MNGQTLVPEHFLAILGVLLFFGLILPRLLRPLHLPFATSLILVGAVLGPHGLEVVFPEETLFLFGLLGATFYMLLAGTEARALGIHLSEPTTFRMVVPTSLLPAATGVAIARVFGQEWAPSLFVGIVFLSSSIMVVFGVVGALHMGRTRTGRLLKRVAIIEDLTASVLAFLLFQTLDPHERFPLPILGGLLLSSVVILRMFLPEVVTFFFARFGERSGAQHEARVRLVIGLFLLVIFAYSALDVHPVIAAFLVGFALAEVPDMPALRERLETLGYGIFIPVFLFVVGLDTDLTVLTRLDSGDALALVILLGAVGSKVLGGLLGAVWAGVRGREIWIASFATTGKLVVPLTSTYAARELGIVDAELFSALVIVSVVSSIFAPLVASLAARGGPAAPESGEADA